MAQGQTKGKYWLGNNPNAEVTNAEVKELGTISETDFGVVSDLNASADEINAACDVLTEAVTSANVIAASENGTRFVLNSATAFASTLPAPAAGLQFWFYIGATEPSGGDHTIVTNSSANIIVGTVSSPEDAAGHVATVTDADTISFKDGKAVHGDYCHVWSDGTNWYLSGMVKVQDGLTLTQAD